MWCPIVHLQIKAQTSFYNDVLSFKLYYSASACEMVMWSPSQTGGFPPGTPVSSHTKTTRTQTPVSTSMINVSCITCFVIVVKWIKRLENLMRWYVVRPSVCKHHLWTQYTSVLIVSQSHLITLYYNNKIRVLFSPESLTRPCVTIVWALVWPTLLYRIYSGKIGRDKTV